MTFIVLCQLYTTCNNLFALILGKGSMMMTYNETRGVGSQALFLFFTTPLDFYINARVYD